MNAVNKPLLAAARIALTLGLVATGAAKGAEALNEDQVAKMQEMGSKVFGIRWAGKVHGGEERGARAISDGTTTLTARGERVFIVNNKKATASSKSPWFRGSDADLRKRGQHILAALDIAPEEIAEVRIMQQATRAGQRLPGGKLKLTAIGKDRRTLLVTRQVKEVPVLSSRLLLDLDAKGKVAFLELSWPQLSATTLETAQRLNSVAHASFQAPALDNASVDSVRAVVLHSPAASFYDDQQAALQVVYRAEGSKLAKKPVRYVDAEGHDLPLPRQTDKLQEEPLKR